ncbi:hypothetical protein N2W22_003000 [Clostridium perfringens]|nr:hypothetical protein [Clostridium perfringens]EJT6657910.1 hypothetical protein [Clostridium perfringens]
MNKKENVNLIYLIKAFSKKLCNTLNISKGFNKLKKNVEFNNLNQIEQLNIIKENDKLLSKKYKEVKNKVVANDIDTFFKLTKDKYYGCNIPIEKARINQYFLGNRKEKANSEFLVNIFCSAMLGSFLSAFLSVNINKKLSDLTKWSFYITFILTILILIVGIILINFCLEILTRDTENKDLYYNIVLEVLSEFESKEKDEKITCSKEVNLSLFKIKL